MHSTHNDRNKPDYFDLKDVKMFHFCVHPFSPLLLWPPGMHQSVCKWHQCSAAQLHASYTVVCGAEHLNFLVRLVPICSVNLWAGNGMSGAESPPTSTVLSCGLSRSLPYLYRLLTILTKCKIPFMFHCFLFCFNFRQSIWFAHLGDAKHGGT